LLCGDADDERRALAHLGLDAEVAAEVLLDGGEHRVHAHAAAGQVGNRVRGREPGPEYEGIGFFFGKPVAFLGSNDAFSACNGFERGNAQNAETAAC
jgi:hypothetical protein